MANRKDNSGWEVLVIYRRKVAKLLATLPDKDSHEYRDVEQATRFLRNVERDICGPAIAKGGE